MTLRERQAVLVEQVNRLGDCFDQYAFLVSRAALLPRAPDGLHAEEYLVKGCQSRVWLRLSGDGDGALHLEADSDTLILKGVLELFAGLVAGSTPEEIAADPWDFLDRTELTVTFPSARMAGLASIVQRIRDAAAALTQ